MSAMRGERFVVDISDEEEEHDAATASNTRANASSSQHSKQPASSAATQSTNALDMIRDIVEREPTAPKAPSLPTFKHQATPTGFPVHKKRISKFKQARQVPSTEAYEQFAKVATPMPFNLPEPAEPTQEEKEAAAAALRKERENETREEEEMRLIDEENKKRLANMSVKEIEQERKELLSQLDPSLVSMLMKRANKPTSSTPSTSASLPEATPKQAQPPPRRVEKDIEKYIRSANLDSGRGDTGIEDLGPAAAYNPDKSAVPIPKPKGKPIQPTKAVRWLEEDEQDVDDTADPLHDPEMKAALQATSAFKHTHAHAHTPPGAAEKCTDPSHDHTHDLDGPSMHFPHPPSAPDLDPNDPNFLETLHSTYFPSLPNDPSKLAWMAPLPTENSPVDLESSYSPLHPALPASALRFDFRGALLPPAIARAMPTSKGLHHHADAPESAGYTIPELARLARSTYPAQRCVAFQVLGRLLFRLGKGGFGMGTEMAMGLWRCVEEGKVLETLQQAAGMEGGHRGVRAYATEAVWLWQRGGGKVMGAI